MAEVPEAALRRTFPVLFTAVNVESGRTHQLRFETRTSARRYHKLMAEFYRDVKIRSIHHDR